MSIFKNMFPKIILTFCLLFGVFAEESDKNCLKRSFCLAAQNGSNEKVAKVVESYKGILKVCKANSGQSGNCQHWQYAVMQELVESYTYGLNASQGKCQEDYVCIRKQPETFEVDVINKRVRVVKAEQCWLLVLHIEYRCVLMYVQESNCIWPSRRHSCLSINIFWPFSEHPTNHNHHDDDHLRPWKAPRLLNSQCVLSVHQHWMLPLQFL